MGNSENTNNRPDDEMTKIIKSLEGIERLITVAKESGDTQGVIDWGIKKAELEKMLTKVSKSAAEGLLGTDGEPPRTRDY